MSKDKNKNKQNIDVEFIVFVFAAIGFVLAGSVETITQAVTFLSSSLNGTIPLNNISNISKLLFGLATTTTIIWFLIRNTIIGYKLLKKFSDQSNEPLYKDFVKSLPTVILIILLLSFYQSYFS